MEMVLKVLGATQIVFGTLLVAGGVVASLLWTWMSHVYSSFIWGGVMVIITGCMTTRLGDKANQIVAEMAATLCLNMVSLALCVHMLHEQVVSLLAFISTFTDSPLTSPLLPLVAPTSDKEESDILNEQFQNLYSARKPKEVVAAIDATLLTALVIVVVTTIISVVKVKACITYRAGEEALMQSWSQPSTGYQHDSLTRQPSVEMPHSYASAATEGRPYSHYEREREREDLCHHCAPKPKVAQLRRPLQAYPVTPDIVQHMYARY